MISFIGNIEAKIDAKGRVFIPSQFRKQLPGEQAFVLRKGLFSECLVLYSQDSWNEMIGVLRSKLSRFNREQDALFRQFVAESERIEMDGQGRILIPKSYLRAIGIASEVRFVGNDSSIEIWSSGKIETTFDEPDVFADKLEKVFQNNEN